jgi:hypothetical protein
MCGIHDYARLEESVIEDGPVRAENIPIGAKEIPIGGGRVRRGIVSKHRLRSIARTPAAG